MNEADKLIAERFQRILKAKEILDKEKATPEERAQICFPGITLECQPLTLMDLCKQMNELKYKGYADSTVHGMFAVKGPLGTWGYSHKSETVVGRTVTVGTEFTSTEKIPD